LQIYFIFARIFARFCKFQKLSQKERAKESAKRREPTLTNVSFFKTVAIDTPGGSLSLKIKSRAQQTTLNPNIIKVKKYSNLNEFTGNGIYIYKIMV
jgi:hypothetical protein